MNEPDFKMASFDEIRHYLTFLDQDKSYLGNGHIVDFLRKIILARRRRAYPFNEYVRLVGNHRKIPEQTIAKLIEANNNSQIPDSYLDNLDVINDDRLPTSYSAAAEAAGGGGRRRRKRRSTKRRMNSRKNRKSRRRRV
jgi:hypothetical protein